MFDADQPHEDPEAEPRGRAWARLDWPANDLMANAFRAGAALERLDRRLRSEPPFAGAFCARMALKAAARAGQRRLADEATLRDQLCLGAAGADPGPQGRALQAWRLLGQPDAGEPATLRQATDLFGLAQTDDLAARLTAVSHAILARPNSPPPVHAAQAASDLVRGWPQAEPLALWVADLALARAMGWRRAVPLIAVGLPARGASILAADGSPTALLERVCAAYAKGALKACEVFAELERAAKKLAAVTPKLRCKQADAIVRRLLDDDVAPGSLRLPGLTPRSVRRLFDRLVSLGAARELTGRSTFRLYGL